MKCDTEHGGRYKFDCGQQKYSVKLTAGTAAAGSTTATGGTADGTAGNGSADDGRPDDGTTDDGTANAQNVWTQPVNVQPAQFQAFTGSVPVGYGPENIDLIKDVPLEVTVELGKNFKIY